MLTKAERREYRKLYLELTHIENGKRVFHSGAPSGPLDAPRYWELRMKRQYGEVGARQIRELAQK